MAAAGIAVGVDRLFFSGSGQAARPDLQRILDGLVSGQPRVAPGASAYVAGPDGNWAGAAGLANVMTGDPMRAHARMRIESNSKTWLTALVLWLAKDGKLSLDDSVARRLPGLLPYGDKVTLRELMSDKVAWSTTTTGCSARAARSSARSETSRIRSSGRIGWSW